MYWVSMNKFNCGQVGHTARERTGNGKGKMYNIMYDAAGLPSLAGSCFVEYLGARGSEDNGSQLDGSSQASMQST